jgi:hypothetical protein
MSVPSAPAAPLVSPPPPPGVAPLPPKARRWAGLGLAGAVVVVVIVVAAAVLAGTILLSGSGSGGGSVSTESSAAAMSTSNSFVSGMSGGPWHLVAIAGIDLTTTYSNDTQPTGPSGNCTISDYTGINLPGYTGNYSDGSLADWAFEYANAAESSETEILVQGGQAKVVEEVGGPECDLGSSGSVSLPTNIVSSTEAATALLTTANISTFVRHNPSANADFILFPFGLLLGEEIGLQWTVIYTTCDLESPSSGPAQGAFAYGDVNATSGAVQGSTYEAAENCSFPTNTTPPPSTPIGTAIAVANPVVSTCPAGSTFAANGCLAGDYTYTLTVEQSTVELGNVLFEVRTASGGLYAPNGPGGFSVMNIADSVEAQYPVPTDYSMVMTAPFSEFGSGVTNTTPITSIDSIVLDMGPTDPLGTGLTFTVLGTNGYSGSTSPIALP